MMLDDAAALVLLLVGEFFCVEMGKNNA